MDGARALVDSQTGYLQANAGAVVVLDARDRGRWWRWRRTRASTPNDFVAGTAPTSTSRTRQPPLLNRGIQPYARARRSRLITSLGDVAVAGAVPDGPNTTYTTTPTAASTSGTTRSACNAGGAVLGAVDLPGALTVSSDIYFYTAGNEFWNAYRDEGQAEARPVTSPATASPTAAPVGNAIQHTARTYGFGEPPGSGSATRPA